MEITSKDIKTQLFNKFGIKNLHVVDNIFLTDFESDFVFVTNSKFMYEVEIKVSKADFNNDFDKCFYVDKWGSKTARSRLKKTVDKKHFTTVKKHDLIQSGHTGFKGFYFAIPEELLNQIDVPDYCGVIVVPKQRSLPYTYFHRSILIHKRAPTLPGAIKITESKINQINEAIKWRYFNDRKKGK